MCSVSVEDRNIKVFFGKEDINPPGASGGSLVTGRVPAIGTSHILSDISIQGPKLYGLSDFAKLC